MNNTSNQDNMRNNNQGGNNSGGANERNQGRGAGQEREDSRNNDM